MSKNVSILGTKVMLIGVLAATATLGGCATTPVNRSRTQWSEPGIEFLQQSESQRRTAAELASLANPNLKAADFPMAHLKASPVATVPVAASRTVAALGDVIDGKSAFGNAEAIFTPDISPPQLVNPVGDVTDAMSRSHDFVVASRTETMDGMKHIHYVGTKTGPTILVASSIAKTIDFSFPDGTKGTVSMASLVGSTTDLPGGGSISVRLVWQHGRATYTLLVKTPMRHPSPGSGGQDSVGILVPVEMPTAYINLTVGGDRREGDVAGAYGYFDAGYESANDMRLRDGTIVTPAVQDVFFTNWALRASDYSDASIGF